MDESTMLAKFSIVFPNKAGELETVEIVKSYKSFDERVEIFFDLCDEYNVGNYQYLCENERIK